MAGTDSTPSAHTAPAIGDDWVSGASLITLLHCTFHKSTPQFLTNRQRRKRQKREKTKDTGRSKSGKRKQRRKRNKAKQPLVKRPLGKTKRTWFPKKALWMPLKRLGACTNSHTEHLHVLQKREETTSWLCLLATSFALHVDLCCLGCGSCMWQKRRKRYSWREESNVGNNTRGTTKQQAV